VFLVKPHANLLRNHFLTQSKLADIESPEALQSQSYRAENVSKTVKDICEGRLVFRIDHRDRRPEDIELISGTVGRLVGYVNDYVSGTKAGEEFEFLEKQLFFCISTLRTYDALKANVNEARLETGLRNLEAKADALDAKLGEVVKMLSRRSQMPAEKPKRAPRKTSRRSKRK
jgi:hypothetical protein